MAGTWTVGEYMPLAGLAKIMDGDSVVVMVPHAGSTAATIARAEAIVAERAALVEACERIQTVADCGSGDWEAIADEMDAVAAAALARVEGGA